MTPGNTSSTSTRWIGLGVFDARLVAAMQIHRLDRILTFNITDFARYGVSVLDPKAVQ